MENTKDQYIGAEIHSARSVNPDGETVTLDGQDHAESPSNFHLQKSHPVQPDFLHNPKDHPGTSADLSVLSGVQSRKHGLSNFF